MFIETHKLAEYGNTSLVFMQSSKVQVYPCGNRRSIVSPGGPGTPSDEYSIPFDPEARLNTEANNRKYSGINGFDQTYLNYWYEGVEGEEGVTEDVDGTLSIVIAGYLFNIKLGQTYRTPNEFAARLLEKAPKNINDISGIYANIRLEEVPLFSSIDLIDNQTQILRAQAANPENLSLDLKKQGVNTPEAAAKPENYYFSGLSFSTEPIATQEDETTRLTSTITVEEKTQQVFSLKILEKSTIAGGQITVWNIHEPARLPKIQHGATVDSVVLGDLESNKITNATEISTPDFIATNATLQNITVPGDGNITKGGKGLIQLDVPQFGKDKYGNDKYQLQFNYTITAPPDAE